VNGPTDAEIAAALRVLAAAIGLGFAPTSSTYSADSLPPGVTRDAFLRMHRARVRGGVAGWSRRGKARLVTADAWQLELTRDTTRGRAQRSVANDRSPGIYPPCVEDDLDRRLGIREKRTA
jgi:hypothetical protein